MRNSLIDEYALSLASLEGDAFQAEVCAHLQRVLLGFQTVPAKPHGDAGLDGFSHEGGRGYCCYGPEHDPAKSTKDRVAAIVEKFSGDLRRLLELDFDDRKLVHRDSNEMAAILPDGQKIGHIELIVNWFESHRVLNPIGTTVRKYKKASQCRWVEPDATVIIVGPKDLANRYAIDEITIVRARQRVFIKKVQQAAQLLTIDNPKDFDLKMEILREIKPDQLQAIDALAETLREHWRMALAFERELNETLPVLHRGLEEARQRILGRVSQLMIASANPWAELPRATEVAAELLASDFDKLYGPLVHDVSSGEIARLIGECPIGWSRPRIGNA